MVSCSSATCAYQKLLHVADPHIPKFVHRSLTVAMMSRITLGGVTNSDSNKNKNNTSHYTLSASPTAPATFSISTWLLNPPASTPPNSISTRSFTNRSYHRRHCRRHSLLVSSHRHRSPTRKCDPRFDPCPLSLEMMHEQRRKRHCRWRTGHTWRWRRPFRQRRRQCQWVICAPDPIRGDRGVANHSTSSCLE
jgi:hypothetical protein